MLDEDYLKSLPEDDIEAIIKLTEEFEKIRSEESNLDEYIRVYIAIKAFANNTNIKVEEVEFVGSDQDNKNKINNYITNVFDKAKIKYLSRTLNAEEENFKALRENRYEYEFKENDYVKIQELINELRNTINSSSALSENHQFRLLKRLEQFQTELHRKVSNLDRALGFLLEVNIIVRQTGEAAKPIYELAKEISKILTQVILISKGLPPGELPPLLK